MIRKHFIIFSIVISSFFLFNSSVHAVDRTFVTSYDFKQVTRDEINNKNWYDAFDYLLEKRDASYSKYLIIPGGFHGYTNPNNIIMLEWNDDDIELLANLFNNTSSDSKNIFYFRLKNTNQKNIKETSYSTTLKKINSTTIINDQQLMLNLMISNAETLNQTMINFEKNITRKIRFKTNQKFKFVVLDETNTNHYKYINYQVHSENATVNYVFKENDYILNEHGWILPQKDFNEEKNDEDSRLYSIDLYIDKEQNINNLDLSINYQDLTNTTNSKADVKAFNFYCKINENNLFHFEKTTTSTIADYTLVRSSQGFKLDLKNINFDFTSCDQIRLAIELNNAYKYKINTTVSNLTINDNNFFYNNLSAEYFRLNNLSNVNQYVIFTTKKESTSNNFYIKNFDQEKDVYVDYFNTKTAKFESSITKTKFNDEFDVFNYNASTKNARGFYIFTRKDDNVLLQMFFKDELYFSFNNNDDMKDSTFIDDTSNVVNKDIETIETERINYSTLDSVINSLNKFVNSTKIYMLKFSDLLSYFYSSLNVHIRNFLVAIFIVLIICVLIKFFRK